MTLFIFLLITVLILVFTFHRKKVKTPKITPNQLTSLLAAHVWFYQQLTEEEQQIFSTKVQRFLTQVHIEAVGFVLKDIDIVLVATSAIIPVFYFKNWQYTNLNTVLIYPDYFDKDLNYKTGERNIAGLVGTGRFENQMILSKKALHHGFKNKTDKYNTAIHEFVHLIDKMDGVVDGIPKVLMTKSVTLPWLDLIHEKMEKINQDESDIRAYGGTSRQEFFAVVAEYFFERPKLLKQKHPELYSMLASCFIK